MEPPIIITNGISGYVIISDEQLLDLLRAGFRVSSPSRGLRVLPS